MSGTFGLVLHIVIALLLVVPGAIAIVHACRKRGFSIVALLISPLPMLVLFWAWGTVKRL